MLTEALAPCDGITLAGLVRAVGLSARRNLKRPRDVEEARDLLRLIEALEAQLLLRPSGDLFRWLRSLRKRVEEHQGLLG